MKGELFETETQNTFPSKTSRSNPACTNSVVSSHSQKSHWADTRTWIQHFPRVVSLVLSLYQFQNIWPGLPFGNLSSCAKRGSQLCPNSKLSKPLVLLFGIRWGGKVIAGTLVLLVRPHQNQTSPLWLDEPLFFGFLGRRFSLVLFFLLSFSHFWRPCCQMICLACLPQAFPCLPSSVRSGPAANKWQRLRLKPKQWLAGEEAPEPELVFYNETTVSDSS